MSVRSRDNIELVFIWIMKVEDVVGRVMMKVVIIVRVIMVGSVLVVKLVLIEALVLS